MRISDWSSDVCSSDLRFVKCHPDRLGERQDERSDVPKLRHQRVPVHGRLAKAGAQRVMMSAEPIQLRAQIVQMSKIAYADGPSADLVLIGGEIGRASCRERGCQYGEHSVVAVYL